MPNKVVTKVEGQILKLSNLGKILYPDIVATKAILIAYYLAVADHILPYLRNRPLTLIRYPDGIAKDRFYSKNKPDWTPSWINSIDIYSEDQSKKSYITANNKATLAWIGNLAALELHPMQVRSTSIDYPDHMIFDLDPPMDDLDWQRLIDVASALGEYLQEQGYTPYVKTSGSKGLHIYVPLVANEPASVVYAEAKRMAQAFVARQANHTTLHLRKDRRNSKILIDVLRNNYHATCVAPFSPRGNKEGGVSMPLRWEDLPSTLSSRDYTISNAVTYVSENGNPWKDWRDQATAINNRREGRLTTAVKQPKTKPDNIKLPQLSGPVEEVRYVAPMLADVTDVLPEAKNYVYEVKWDGIRAIITKANDTVTIYSRSGNDISSQFPKLSAELARSIQAESAILDGEIVVLDNNGKPDFSSVISRLHLKSSVTIGRRSSSMPATLMLFDILHLDGQSVTDQPLTIRTQYLSASIEIGDLIRISEQVEDGKALLQAVKQYDLEGVMCKDVRAPYIVGHRSRGWLKLKTRHNDEAWIIGYTAGKGDRKGLVGAFHLAKIDGDRITYMGKVGTGLDLAALKAISQKLADLSHVAKPIEDNISEPDRTIWVEPRYQCQIKYASKSSTGTYREPVFVKLIDK